MSAVLVGFPGLKRSNTGKGVAGRRAQRAAEDSEVEQQQQQQQGGGVGKR